MSEGDLLAATDEHRVSATWQHANTD